MLKETLKNDPTLQSQDVNIEVVGRTKELYSLWHKMEMKHDRNLDHITDLVALRVILTPGEGMNNNEADSGVWLCYHVLGLVQVRTSPHTLKYSSRIISNTIVCFHTLKNVQKYDGAAFTRISTHAYQGQGLYIFSKA